MLQLTPGKVPAVKDSSEIQGQVMFSGPELVLAQRLCWEMKSV